MMRSFGSHSTAVGREKLAIKSSVKFAGTVAAVVDDGLSPTAANATANVAIVEPMVRARTVATILR